MKDIVKFLLEAEESQAAAGGEDNGEFTPSAPKGKHIPVFWGYQSDKEIPFDDIYYYVIKGKDYDNYEKDLEKVFAMLARGKFGKDVIVKTAVDNRAMNSKAMIDEENVFVYDRPKKTLYNINDTKQYYKSAKEFAEDEGLWGLIVVDDDTHDTGGWDSRRSSSSIKSQRQGNSGY